MGIAPCLKHILKLKPEAILSISSNCQFFTFHCFPHNIVVLTVYLCSHNQSRSLLDHPAVLQPVGSALGEEATQWEVLLRVRVAAKEETGMMGVA